MSKPMPSPCSTRQEDSLEVSQLAHKGLVQNCAYRWCCHTEVLCQSERGAGKSWGLTATRSQLAWFGILTLDGVVSISGDFFAISLNRGWLAEWQGSFKKQVCSYRRMPIFRHPFFRKQCFSLKYSLVSPPQNFWGMPKFGIYVIMNSSLQF